VQTCTRTSSEDNAFALEGGHVANTSLMVLQTSLCRLAHKKVLPSNTLPPQDLSFSS
jgi:hypothetical protein